MRTEIRLAIAIGSAWGLSEAVVRLSTRAVCPAGMIGSALTGAALLFFFFGRGAGLKPFSLILTALAAAALKVGTSLAVGVPLLHGAIWNPVFAYSLEMAAFLLVMATAGGWAGQSLLRTAFTGGSAALVAALAFPLSGAVTGFPVCTMPGSNLPVSWAYAPVAVVLAMAASPLGLMAGNALRRGWEYGPERGSRRPLAIHAAAVAAGLLTLLLAFLDKHISS